MKTKSSAHITSEFGPGELHAYEFSDGNYLAFVAGDITGGHNVLTRVHDQCLTADIFHCARCDCRQQRIAALEMISKSGRGVLIHTPLEGRGHGLLAKIRQYATQNATGLDTIEAARLLGFKDDSRDYKNIPIILRDLGIESITLLSNNPRKEIELRKAGVKIIAVKSIVVDGLSQEAIRNLEARQRWIRDTREP